MQLFDTHTHVNFQPFQDEYIDVINRALQAGVFINNVGSQWESSQRSVEIADEFAAAGKTGVWASIGVHPIHVFTDVQEEQVIEGKTQTINTRAEKFDYDRYRALAESSDNVIAIGECGLDYLHFERSNLQNQRQELIQLQLETLREHIRLAIDLDLPMVIHCRDAEIHDEETLQAFEHLLALLREYNTPGVSSQQQKVRGVIHCYTGIPKYVPQFLELGFYIGYTGIVTFPNAKEVRASLRATPLERILLETDAPYLTPVPHRGKRNEPSYVRHVAEQVADLKQITVVEVAERTTQNAVELFRVKC